MSRKSYKTVANELFIDKLTNDFPEWDVVQADIGSGVIVLRNGDISVKMTYKDDLYYINQIVKDETGDIPCGNLENIISLFRG